MGRKKGEEAPCITARCFNQVTKARLAILELSESDQDT